MTKVSVRRSSDEPNFTLRTGKLPSVDYYRVLGITRRATHLQVKQAYLALARQHHPDVGGDAAVMATITEAHSILGDKDKRKAYDAAVNLLSRPCGYCHGEGQTYRTKGFTQRVGVPCKVCGGTGRQDK